MKMLNSPGKAELIFHIAEPSAPDEGIEQVDQRPQFQNNADSIVVILGV